MRAVKIPEIGRAELIEMENPKAGPNEVVVKVHATGICGSDIAGFLGTHSFRVPPVITGHELAGTVTELGEGVQDLDVGDAVANPGIIIFAGTNAYWAPPTGLDPLPSMSCCRPAASTRCHRECPCPLRALSSPFVSAFMRRREPASSPERTWLCSVAERSGS